jgi:hypothetical protein
MNKVKCLENGLEKADQDKCKLQQILDDASAEKEFLESGLAKMV